MLRLKTILRYKYITLIFLLLVIVVAFIRNAIPIESNININSTNFTGIITDYYLEGNKLSFIIDDNEKIKCTYYLKDKKELNNYNKSILGYKVKVKGELSLPSNNTISNTFNYKKYLDNMGIVYTLSVSEIVFLNNDVNIMYSIKNKLIDYINTFKSNNYLQMFIIGNKKYLDDEVINQYKDLGVIHVFAISGMHVSLLSGIILKLLKKVRNRIKYTITIIFLFFYMFITSFSPSIVRSVVFFILLFINKEYDFNLKTINIFYLTIGMILLFNYRYLYNIGFIYSSVTSFALIKYSDLLKGNYIVSLLKVSLLSFLFSLPITVSMNYNVNILSVINNLIIVPLITFLVYPLSIITLLIKPLDSVFFLVTQLVEYISGNLFVFNVVIPKMNVIVIILYYMFFTLYLLSYQKRFLILMLFLFLFIKSYLYFDKSVYVTYFDVNQGDSILIRKNYDVILIDTGGKIKYKEDKWKQKKEYHISDNIIQYLKSLGINSISELVLTHGDYDHMGEAINLVENIKVENVIFNCGEYNDLEQELIKVLDKKNIKYYSCIKELNIDKYKLHFLNTKEYDNENDNSNVIYLNYNNYKFLFMGDAGVRKEKDILDKYNLFNIDFLKVGHHGSNTSSSEEFINSINPKYSLISVGKNNRYGQPKDSVLDTLKNSKIYRIDVAVHLV